jgi:hypothetical protein
VNMQKTSRTDKDRDKANAEGVRAFALAMLGRISTREAAEALVKAIEARQTIKPTH